MCVQIYTALSPLTFPQTPDELREGDKRQREILLVRSGIPWRLGSLLGLRPARSVRSHTIRHRYQEAIVPYMAIKRVRCQRFVVKYFI